jgi:hypothetical protein
MAFLSQFWCTPRRLTIPDTLCIQLYQSRGIDEGDDPLPVALALPMNAVENDGAYTLEQAGVTPYDVGWEPFADPDDIDGRPDHDPLLKRLFRSKAGGTPFFPDEVTHDETFLFQLEEEPAGFNFAGRLLMVMRRADGSLRVRLA